MCIADVDDGC